MPLEPLSLALVAAVFVLAGAVKGVVGMGLPTVAMGLLALLMPPVQAAALLVVPSLVTNLWQLFAGPAFAALLRRLAGLVVGIGVGTALGIGWLTGGSSRGPALALGTVLAAYAAAGLLLPRLSVPARWQPLLSPLVGLLTGVLSGATGVFVVPVVPYLGAIGLDREQLIQALGLSFTVSTLALAAGLALAGSYPGSVALQSVAAVVPALVGLRLGQALRHRLDAEVFRRCFFASMLVLGLFMALRALVQN